MIDQFMQLQLADKYNIKPDRIVFTASIPGTNTLQLSITDALNGAILKNNLSTHDYFLTKYTVWTQNGIIQIDIEPDGESSRKIITYALVQKTESPFIPIVRITSDISILLTNNLPINDDVFIIIDMWKIPQTNVAMISDISNSLISSITNIDIQTLGIEKFLTVTNLLLQALVIANKGVIPNVTGFTTPTPAPSTNDRCKRP